MYQKFQQHLASQLADIKAAGLYKNERILITPQGTRIMTAAGRDVLNFCANNYLGLSNHPELIRAAREAMESHGYGMSSVRFICGTSDLHKELEQKISKFFGTEDTILYAAAFDANGGVFEGIVGTDDVIISDELNHASIIDGIRLCKAKRQRYKHMDMADLERLLIESKSCPHRLIATDGIFSMDGDIAPLPQIVEMAKKHDAVLFVDESHATGFIGKTGRGTPELFGVEAEIDMINSTLGKGSLRASNLQPLVGPPEDTRPGARRSPRCSDREAGLTSSRTRWRLPSSEPRWPSSTC